MICKFIDKNGTFKLDHPDNSSYLYLPLTNESGVMNSITPDGHGDSKLNQNEFLLEPVSNEDLHTSMQSRNFWCDIKDYGPWSVWGTSADQESKKYIKDIEDSTLTVGKLWQKLERKNHGTGLKAEVLNFCPPTNEKVEIMEVILKNEGEKTLKIRPIAAVPIYGRGADHIRDHRHVTSLFHQAETTEDGVLVKPTLSFDENGHGLNEMSYGVFGREDNGRKPVGFYPSMEEFVGEGGNLYWPRAVVAKDVPYKNAGTIRDGYEAMGAIEFEPLELKSGEEKKYIILLSYNEEGMMYLDSVKVDLAFQQLEEYWQDKSPISCETGNGDFDHWMSWVGIQPHLRRIFGCSFLPHHDYGRGGRGWRDLWQDCLALILVNPLKVREDLISFYSGVRLDGSNATIIGTKPGEFKADRNAIVRVWMDHGYWPLVTTNLYLNQTGDYSMLFEQVPYFFDGLTARGEERFEPILTSFHQNGFSEGEQYAGTVLEHLFVQNITQFFDVGEHNHMRLRGADWNDALDMAKERGESVAFTAAYSGNYDTLSRILATLEKRGEKEISLSKELVQLMKSNVHLYDDIDEKQRRLEAYYESTKYPQKEKVVVSIEECRNILTAMGQWIQHHIRGNEVIETKDGDLWINGYYDNLGEQVEGLKESGVRFMLTSQVFAIMSRTVTDDQLPSVSKSVDRYLFDHKIGGYRLNTNFHEVKLNLGRAFGFAYGHKENGAVFCHMAIMYAYALYSRGFAKEGFRVIDSLNKQNLNFDMSRIYPGIPEYFNEDGRGMYHYLTGAGSWLVLTVITQMFGVKGTEGDLALEPQLLKEQFDSKGQAKIQVMFADRKLKVIYENKNRKEIGDYDVEELYLNGEKLGIKEARISRQYLEDLDKNKEHEIRVIL